MSYSKWHQENTWQEATNSYLVASNDAYIEGKLVSLDGGTQVVADDDIVIKAADNLIIRALGLDSTGYRKEQGLSLGINLVAAESQTNLTSGSLSINSSKSSNQATTYTNAVMLAGAGCVGDAAAGAASAFGVDVDRGDSACGILDLAVGADLTALGANLHGQVVNIDVGGDLSLLSLQNTSTGTSSGWGLNISYDFLTNSVSSFGVNVNSGSHDRAWVDRIASLTSAEGLTIKVGGTTRLLGSLIASGDNSLHLITDTLEYEHIANWDRAVNSGFGFSMSTGEGALPSVTITGDGKVLEGWTYATIGGGRIAILSEGYDETDTSFPVLTEEQIAFLTQLNGTSQTSQQAEVTFNENYREWQQAEAEAQSNNPQFNLSNAEFETLLFEAAGLQSLEGFEAPLEYDDSSFALPTAEAIAAPPDMSLFEGDGLVADVEGALAGLNRDPGSIQEITVEEEWLTDFTVDVGQIDQFVQDAVAISKAANAIFAEVPDQIKGDRVQTRLWRKMLLAGVDPKDALDRLNDPQWQEIVDRQRRYDAAVESAKAVYGDDFNPVTDLEPGVHAALYMGLSVLYDADGTAWIAFEAECDTMTVASKCAPELVAPAIDYVKDNYHTIVATTIADVINLKGISQDLDAILQSSHGGVPFYELPSEQQKQLLQSKGLDELLVYEQFFDGLKVLGDCIRAYNSSSSLHTGPYGQIAYAASLVVEQVLEGAGEIVLPGNLNYKSTGAFNSLDQSNLAYAHIRNTSERISANVKDWKFGDGISQGFLNAHAFAVEMGYLDKRNYWAHIEDYDGVVSPVAIANYLNIDRQREISQLQIAMWAASEYGCAFDFNSSYGVVSHGGFLEVLRCLKNEAGIDLAIDVAVDGDGKFDERNWIEYFRGQETARSAILNSSLPQEIKTKLLKMVEQHMALESQFEGAQDLYVSDIIKTYKRKVRASTIRNVANGVCLTAGAVAAIPTSGASAGTAAGVCLVGTGANAAHVIIEAGGFSGLSDAEIDMLITDAAIELGSLGTGAVIRIGRTQINNWKAGKGLSGNKTPNNGSGAGNNVGSKPPAGAGLTRAEFDQRYTLEDFPPTSTHTPEELRDSAWKVYQDTRYGDKEIVMGRSWDTEVGEELGMQRLNTNVWSPEVNDAWVQGGIDGRKSFYVGSTADVANYRAKAIFDESGNFLGRGNHPDTVFFREMRQLRDAGYRLEGNVMVPPTL